jgi:hypothetical protein
MFDAENEWVVRIHAQLRDHADFQRQMPYRGEALEVPTPQTLADVLEVAFWASLTSNEGRPTRVRLAILRAGTLEKVLEFAHPAAYSDEEVAKLAPAVSSTGYLAVDAMQTPATIWGISSTPMLERRDTLVVDVSDPGVIRVGLGPFQSFMVFSGRSATMLHGAGDMALSARVASALGKDLTEKGGVDAHVAWRESLALGILARMVLEERHGGMLLVVPRGNATWMESLLPFTHQFVEADHSVRDSIAAAANQTEDSKATALSVLQQSPVSEDVRGAIVAALSQVNWHPESILRPIARLAAVDGAVVLSDDLDVLGFGAMVNLGSIPDVYLLTASPEDAVRIRIEDAGGSRHQAAVRFVGQSHGSIALVISHEGHLSLTYWSARHAAVLMLKNAEWWV